MSRVDTGRLLGLATKVLAQKALERAHGGWIPEKQRIKQEKEALRAHEKQKKEAEKRSKLQTGGIPDENQPYDLGQQLQTGARFAAEIPASVNRLFVEPVTTGIQELMRPVFEGEKYSADPETGEVRSSYQTPEMVEHSMNVVGGLGAGSMLTGPSAASTNVLRSGMGPVAKEAVAQAPRQLSPLGFYSPAAERAAALQPSGDAAQMVAALKNTQGIKAEELMNAGLIDAQGNVHPDWAGRGKVTREDLVSHLQGQMPQVEETVLGYNRNVPGWEIVNQDNRYMLRRPDGSFHTAPNSDIPATWSNETAAQAALNFNAKDSSSATKYSQYTLPGGENYREVLLKYKDPANVRKMEIENAQQLRDVTPEETAEHKSLLGSAIDYRSPHWDDPNVLAHIRMADRTGPNGEKILHVEELQSDWGQKGKKEGFASSAPVSKFKIGDMAGFNAEYNDFFNKWLLSSDNQSLGVINQNKKGKYIPEVILRQGVGHNLGEFNTPEEAINAVKNLEVHGHKQTHSLNEIPVDAEKLTAMYLSKDEAEKAAIKHGIPSAPYVTSTEGWTDLALKRVLKEAAEGGYDKVVWTPGAEQAKRYDLSKQVDELIARKNPDGTFGLSATLPGGGKHDIGASIPAEKLSDYVGKEMAEKISNQEFKTDVYSGDDLKVGGEGMKGYYDTIVPKRLQNIAKKYDKEARLGFSEASGTGRYEVVLQNGKVIADYPDKVSADAIARRQQGAIVRSNNLSLPSLDITPAMRESILRGQSAYQRGGAVRKDFKQAHADARSQGLKTFTWTDPATGKEGTYTTALKRKEGGRVYSLADHSQWKEPS